MVRTRRESDNSSKQPTRADASSIPSLGAKLRALRRSRGLTIKDVAGASELTESFISQVERDSANPSIASVFRIADALAVQIGDLFDSVGKPHGRVVRRSKQSRISFPGSKSTDALLSPNLHGKLQVTWAEMSPGGSSGDESYSHPGEEECVVVTKGTLEICVGDERYVLKAGDAITFESRIEHKWRNVGRGSVTAVWIQTPPSASH